MKKQINHLLLLALALSFPVYAEKADKTKPVNIEADRARMDDINKTAIYEGHVVLTQGTIMILADRIDVVQDEAGFSSGVAIGKQVYFRQKMEASEEYVEGWANKLDYDGRAEKVKLYDHAHLKRGIDDLRGNFITYDAKTEYFQAQGSASGTPGRVRAVIRPKNSETPAAPAGKKP